MFAGSYCEAVVKIVSFCKICKGRNWERRESFEGTSLPIMKRSVTMGNDGWVCSLFIRLQSPILKHPLGTQS